MVKSKLSYEQLSENRRLCENYKESSDASYLIGKDYSILGRDNKLYLHELRMIPISKIVKTSEEMRYKDPIYKQLTTVAPPVDVTPLPNGKYRLFNGHRRLKSAKARGEKFIFAEIHYGNELE